MKGEELLLKATKTSTEIAKKAANSTIKAGRKFAQFQIPASINWIYGFGFKIGVYLALKSFLILRYQWHNLAPVGFITLVAQFFMAYVMIIGGATMQNQGMYEDPNKLRRAARKYGFMTIGGSLIMAMKVLMKWGYFKNPNTVNWFVDLFNSISKGVSELGLSILFWDSDVWLAFCALLYLIADAYLYEIFDDPKCWSGKLKRLVHRQKALPPVGLEDE